VNLLDRYIFRSVLFTAIAAVALFTFVLAAGNIIRDLLGPLLSGQLPIGSFIRLVLLLVPFVTYYALPLGMLTGVLLTLGRLSSDSEVTAMRAAGMSVLRIARPAFILAAIGVCIGLRVNFESMPWARVQYHRELAVAVRANPMSYIRPKTFIREFPGYVIYVGAKDQAPKDGNDLRDVWIWALDSQKRVIRFVRAESGKVAYDEATNDFVISLTNTREEDHDQKAPDVYTQPLLVSTVGQIQDIRLSLARYFGQGAVNQKLPWMTYRELIAEKARVEQEPLPKGGEKQKARDVLKVSLTIQDKINMAVAIFSFAFIGVPLGIKVSRKETSANLGVAVLLALAYYFLVVVVGWLDQHPEYHPDLLLWIPNFVLLSLGGLLLYRLDRAS
jgi:lipopolysaccharide export system permease protein